MIRASTLSLAPEDQPFHQGMKLALHHERRRFNDIQSYGFMSTTPKDIIKCSYSPVIKHKQQQQSSSRRGVRFDESSTSTFFHDYPYEADCRWIDEDTLQDIRARNKKMAARRSTPEFDASIEFLMHSYSNKNNNNNNNNCNPNENEPTLQQNNKDETSQIYRPEELPKHVSRIVHTNCRGLERWMSPTMSAARRRYHRDVLAWQRKLKKDGLAGTPFGDDILREQSLSRSQAHRQLAFRLAQADEWELKRCC